MLLYGVFLTFVLTVLFLMQRAHFGGHLENMRLQGIYPRPGQGTLDDVKRLAQRGEKILAIRLYREIHGTGLKDSKEAVEAIMASQRGESPPPAPGDIDGVKRILQTGDKIGAIKLYREITGMGLKESKDAVEAMARSDSGEMI